MKNKPKESNGRNGYFPIGGRFRYFANYQISVENFFFCKVVGTNEGTEEVLYGW